MEEKATYTTTPPARQFRLAELMEARNVTPADITKRLRITRQAVSYLVNKPPAAVKLKTLYGLCEVLGCSPNELLGWE
jgi:DNA-binding Xre family transcriptional regulator